MLEGIQEPVHFLSHAQVLSRSLEASYDIYMRAAWLTKSQISELKEHLDQIPTSAHAQDDNSIEIPGPDLLFGRQRHATKQELLAALPQRAEADQLIGSYFSSMNTAPSKLGKVSEKVWG